MSAPAGWYDDGAGRQRWWDGLQWTEHYGPAPISGTGSPHASTAQTDQPTLAFPLAGQVAAVGDDRSHFPPQGLADGVPASQGGSSARGFAITALIIGIVAFLAGWIPVLGVLLGAGAIVFAIIALRKRGSKALAITAIVLGSVAAVSSIAMTAGMAIVASNAPSSAGRPAPADTDEQGEPGSVDTVEPSPTPSAEEDEEPSAEPEENEAPPAATGSAENPMPQPYIAEGLFGGEKYSLTAKVYSASANEQIEDWNMFNSEPPAGYKYVVVEMTMTGIDPDGVEPSLATFDLFLATAEGNRYDAEYVFLPEGMTAMSDGPTLYPGNAFTGYSAYIVPEAAVGFLLYDNSNYIALP